MFGDILNANDKQTGPLHPGDTLRVTFDTPVGLMVHGGYKLYKVIASCGPSPGLDETWDVEVTTTWENTENRSRYPYTVAVRPISKVTIMSL